MTSYQSRGLTSPSEINVVRPPMVAATSHPLEEEDEATANPELIRIHVPAEKVTKSFEAPTEKILRPKSKVDVKSKLKRLKKLDYWMEGSNLNVF
jgi:hypothetical protein